MSVEDLVELKFRLYDGSDIGPIQYSSNSTVATLKERVISEWPKVLLAHFTSHQRQNSMLHRYVSVTVDKKMIPRVANEVKLISAGRILENNKTVAQCRPAFGELPGGIITMHVVVQPSSTKTKTEKKVDELPKKNTGCACCIL